MDVIPGFIAALFDPDWREKVRKQRNGKPPMTKGDTYDYWERRMAEGAIADMEMADGPEEAA